MRGIHKRLLGLLLAAAMMTTLVTPAGAAYATIESGTATIPWTEANIPSAQWQIKADFPG